METKELGGKREGEYLGIGHGAVLVEANRGAHLEPLGALGASGVLEGVEEGRGQEEVLGVGGGQADLGEEAPVERASPARVSGAQEDVVHEEPGGLEVLLRGCGGRGRGWRGG